jgi:hypothetical protein
MSAFVTQGGISDWAETRQKLKETNPFLYGIFGGDRATSYTVKNLEAQSSVGAVSGKVVDSVKGGFDLLSWIVANWQVSIVGGLALVLLLKRL